MGPGVRARMAHECLLEGLLKYFGRCSSWSRGYCCREWVSLNRVMQDNMGWELQLLWVVEGKSVSYVSGVAAQLGKAASPVRCHAAAPLALVWTLCPRLQREEMAILARLLFLVLSTAKAGCCVLMPACFTPGVFKICLKPGESNMPVTGEGEREWRLSPASVVQDGIYDLWPFFKLDSLIFVCVCFQFVLFEKQ